jgi:cytochrome c553
MQPASTMKKTLIIATLFGLTAATSALAADAKENWDKICAKCHGADGKGDTKPGKKLDIKDLSDAKFQATFSDDDAFKALKSGLNDKDGKVRMKAAEGLSDDDMKALVAYVRKLKA